MTLESVFECCLHVQRVWCGSAPAMQQHRAVHVDSEKEDLLLRLEEGADVSTIQGSPPVPQQGSHRSLREITPMVGFYTLLCIVHMNKNHHQTPAKRLEAIGKVLVSGAGFFSDAYDL